MSLLWVDCNEQQATKRDETLQHVRQHVMLNYLFKKDELSAKNSRLGTQSQQLIPHAYAVGGPLETQVQSAKRGASAKTVKGQRKKTNRSQAVVPSQAHQVGHLPTPPLSPALVSSQDREIYQAAWWHSYGRTVKSGENWIAACRRDWGNGFWEFAKDDSTLREIFMSFAAAKEAAVRALPESRAYFLHKGRAIRLVGRDLQREGRSLRVAALATMCLLCKASFIEEDYVAGESHLRAISILVSSQLYGIPNFLWSFVVWADLRLTGVSLREPTLPCVLHPDFAHAALPIDMIEQARFLAGCNMLSLPDRGQLPESTAFSLFEKLHQLASAYNRASKLSRDWLAPWALSYDIAYMVASLRFELRKLPSTSTIFSPERVILLAASIEFWCMSSHFVPQPGLMQHHLQQMTEELADFDPSTLSSSWLGHGCTLDSLLWALSNAGACAVKQWIIGVRQANEMPEWLRQALRHVKEDLCIQSLEQYISCLRSFPYAEHWNGQMAGPVYTWIIDGIIAVSISPRLPGALYAETQLTFDPSIDEQGLSIVESK